MPAPFVRPPAADLVYRLYDRALHPELFPTLTARTVRRGDFALTVRITPFGHVAEWSRGAARVTELTAPADWELPERGRRIGHRFRGEQRGRCEVGGVRVQVSLQAEELPPELFLPLHEELAADGAKRGLLFHFRPHHRLGLTPLGWVTAELLPAGLALGAFHTFPDEFTVIKTQTLLEPAG